MRISTVRAAAGLKMVFLLLTVLLAGGCSDAYYGAMEKVGVHKRDIMVDRVEEARDSQEDAQEQFTSALEQFESVIGIEETGLKKAYDRLNAEYENSVAAAENVTARIDKVEDVAEALFEEWEEELELYQNPDYKLSSRQKLRQTRDRYRQMLKKMHRAEQSMEPVLKIFRDNVLFLKHNLNAQAIGSLQGEFASLQSEIGVLLERMKAAIDSSNDFIKEIKS